MKRINRINTRSFLVIMALAASPATVATAQNTLQFTGVSATSENAIQLFWASNINEVYEVDYADSLIDPNTGITTWAPLYTDYPSQGTNTFIGDFGNYDIEPPIPHPKYMPMRFYRILDLGTDTTSDEPSVAIVSPTNGLTVSDQLTVTVVAATDQATLSTKLYVDGQEMDESDDGSNYVINTCEWPNGPHTLFATATARSGMSGPTGIYPIYTGHAVSACVQVTFNNLISRIAFSQAFFEPSLGQTQEITATLSANCNWTLQIQDVNTNTVRNASGSGGSVAFDWDGTGDGETNIPDGIYTYLISAQPNGEPNDMASSGSSRGSDGSPPTSAFFPAAFATLDSPELWAVNASSSGHSMPLPLAIYPPGFDTNNLTIFEALPSEIQSLRPSHSLSQRSAPSRTKSAVGYISGGGISANDSGSGGGGSSGQSSSAPTRPPTAPVKNAVNDYVIGYYSWPTPQTVNIPKNGLPFPATGVCHLDGSSYGGSTFDNIPEAATMSQNMERAMKRYGWKLGSINGDQNLPVNSIRRGDLGYGGGEIFTTATVGFFLDHGDYGTDPDYNPGSSGSKQVYFRSDVDGGDNGWLRMCQFGFGGNLKWMAILACNSLCDPNFSSMKNAGAIPLKTTHLVCGATTITAVGEDIGTYWTKNMLKKNQTIADAWFNAGRLQYSYGIGLNPIGFRVVGYPECMSDTVNNNTAPSYPSASPGNLTKQDSQVYP